MCLGMPLTVDVIVRRISIQRRWKTRQLSMA